MIALDRMKSAAGHTKRSEMLLTMRGFAKQADLGGEQESGFEQAFSSLAYAYLKDKAPRLLDFIVGFQLVDRNEDNTKAVGVFGFKVGKQWLYAPVFFLNGDLKGHELLYIKNQDTFVPMKENWVNYIMSRKPHVLGEGSQKDVFQLGGLAPNIEKLSIPPHRSKFGADDAGGKATWVKDILPLLAACEVKAARFLFRNQDHNRGLAMDKIAADPLTAAVAGCTAMDLRGFLASNIHITKAAFDVYEKYPLIKQAFDRFYGRDFFAAIGRDMHARIKTSGDSILPRHSPQLAKQAQEFCRMLLDVPPASRPAIWQRLKQANEILYHKSRKEVKKLVGELRTGSLIPVEKKAAAAKPKVKITVNNDQTVTENLPELSEMPDIDKQKLLHHGYLVKDERAGDELSVAYNTQVLTELTNPQETGLYDVLEAPGDFARMLIIANPSANDGGHAFVTVVRLDGDNKAWLNAHRTAVFAKRIEMDEDYQSWFKELGEKADLAEGAYYVAVSARGEGTCPFVVREKLEGGQYRVDFKTHENFDYGRMTNLPLSSYSKGRDGPYISPHNALVTLNQRPETKLRAIAGELNIPDTFRFLKLKDPPKPRQKSDSILALFPCCDADSGSDPSPIRPGNIKDIQLLFTQKTAHMKLLEDHHEVIIRTEKRGNERLSWTQGLFSLIKNHGLSEQQAGAMLKVAQAKGHAIYRIKYADQYQFPGPGPSAPTLPAPEYGSEQVGYNNVNAIYPQEEEVPVPGMDASLTDPRVYDPFLMPDQNALNVAQEAGQSGQKEVFDTTMIASMLKAVRQDSLVDRYLGDLMKALDKLCRILFMFYWHQDQFADRYGKAELPELEDSIRNAIETLGDVTLFLKEKTIEPGLDDMQDPTVDEAASN